MDTDAVILAEVTRRGRRLLTRLEILALGISPEEIECRVRRASWLRIHAGVYLIGAGALTHEEQACAATLAGAPHTYTSGVVGARLHGIGDWGSFLEVWAPHGTEVVARGVRVHRTRKAGVPVVMLGSCRVPTACVEQVLLDLASRLPRRALHQAFTTAWRKRRTNPAAVLAHVARFGGRGVKGGGVLRELAELYAGVAARHQGGRRSPHPRPGLRVAPALGGDRDAGPRSPRRLRAPGRRRRAGLVDPQRWLGARRGHAPCHPDASGGEGASPCRLPRGPPADP